MAVPHPSQSKSELRAFLHNKRQDFVTKRRTCQFESPPEVAARLQSVLAGRSALAGYASLKDEPDVLPLLVEIARQGFATGLPFMAEAEMPMAFRSWGTGDPLIRSPFGFRQPVDSAPLFVPDAILVPLVGFDRILNRLGHGKGHYDRALAHWPQALKIGVAWSVQEVGRVPADPWDVPLDAVMTEREWIA